MAVPNEYPGQIYAFNWSLNADGVTPLKKSAFRITKPLDLKVAGLEQPKTNPLKVTMEYGNSLSEIVGLFSHSRPLFSVFRSRRRQRAKCQRQVPTN